MFTVNTKKTCTKVLKGFVNALRVTGKLSRLAVSEQSRFHSILHSLPVAMKTDNYLQLSQVVKHELRTVSFNRFKPSCTATRTMNGIIY